MSLFCSFKHTSSHHPERSGQTTKRIPAEGIQHLLEGVGTSEELSEDVKGIPECEAGEAVDVDVVLLLLVVAVRPASVPSAPATGLLRGQPLLPILVINASLLLVRKYLGQGWTKVSQGDQESVRTMNSVLLVFGQKSR